MQVETALRSIAALASQIRSWIVVALAIVVSAGCAWRPAALTTAPVPASTAVRSAPFSAELSEPALREAGFDKAWTLVNERFYDPRFNGVDWEAVRLSYRPQLQGVRSDNQFFSLIERMVSELHDSHTRAYNANEYHNRLTYVASTYGIRVSEIDGEVAITHVLPDSSADEAGVRPGMVVDRINGEPAIERLRRLESQMPVDASPERRLRNLYGRVVTGRGKAPIVLEAHGAAGASRFEIAPTEQEILLEVTQRTLEGNLGYVSFNRFRSDVATDVAEALTSLHDTDGLVLDLRGNPGGSIGAMLSIAHSFFPETRHVLTRRARGTVTLLDERDSDGRPRSVSPEVRVSANVQAYTRPIAILIDGYTASSSELLATMLREQRGAYVVGRASCGCVVAVRSAGYSLPGGGALYVAETGFVTPQGNRMEGAGMRPDFPVALTLRDLRDGVDRDLLEATQWLAQRAHKVAQEH